MIKWYRSKLVIARENNLTRYITDSYIKNWDILEIEIEKTKRLYKWKYKEHKPFYVYVFKKDL
jgi:hypothetical protein